MGSFFSSSFLHSKTVNQWDTYTDIIGLLFAITVIFICRNTNKSGDDKEFIERYICLGVPATTKAFIITLPAGIVLVTAEVFLDEALNKSNIFSFIYIVIILLYYFWRLNSAIKIASH
jgi:hypothetical protein